MDFLILYLYTFIKGLIMSTNGKSIDETDLRLKNQKLVVELEKLIDSF